MNTCWFLMMFTISFHWKEFDADEGEGRATKRADMPSAVRTCMDRMIAGHVAEGCAPPFTTDHVAMTFERIGKLFLRDYYSRDLCYLYTEEMTLPWGRSWRTLEVDVVCGDWHIVVHSRIVDPSPVYGDSDGVVWRDRSPTCGALTTLTYDELERLIAEDEKAASVCPETENCARA